MTIFLLANSIFIVASVLYGWLAGDRHDREGVFWIAAAIIGTLLVQVKAASDIQMVLILIIDAALLFAMVSLALRSTRYWPIWFAGFHLLTVTANVALVVFGEIDMLRLIAAFFGTPAILSMVIGIFLDRLAESRARAAI